MLAPVEGTIDQLAGACSKEQSWQSYALAMLAFNAVGFITLYGLQRLQGILPLDP
jgi:potassium-transporting ATPase potassium-binding subunit